MFEQCLFFNSNALARTVTSVWVKAYKPFDLSPPHAFMLRVVLAKPGLMPRELARELKLSRSTVTRFLDSLEKRQFLIRKMTEKDGREIQIYPTQAAIQIHQQLDQIGNQLSQRMGKIIGQDELSNTVLSMRKLQNILEEN
ncbi:MAG: MarR family transcriptional regulator [Oceanospirillaceae bacterium]|nr:MarR family transcriptional regulator [Oceanospirillaceae bacterium]